MVASQVTVEAAPMSNDPGSPMDDQVPASGTLPVENRHLRKQRPLRRDTVVEPDSLLGSLVWIAPPLVLIAMLAISAIQRSATL